MGSEQAIIYIRYETIKKIPGTALIYSNIPKSQVSAQKIYQIIDKKIFNDVQEDGRNYMLLAANLDLKSKNKYLVELERHSDKVLPIKWDGQSRVKVVLHGVKINDHWQWPLSSEESESSPEKASDSKRQKLDQGIPQ